MTHFEKIQNSFFDQCANFLDVFLYGLFGIQCASINQFEMEWDASVWINGSYSEVIPCPPGFVGTGRCGSASSAACDVDTNTFPALQCTPFAYPSRRRRRRN